METIGQAALDIIPQLASDFDRRLAQSTSGPLTVAGSSGGRRYGDSAGRSMLASFTSHARRAAVVSASILAAGVGAAGYAAFKIGRDSLAEAREAQKIGALTTQVIKTTGGAANVTAKEVGNLSNALSLKTGVDDEVIQRGANMLLTFKSIRNEVGKNNDIFNQSVAITEDMAAAMAGGTGGGDLDLKSSSILVGKALNDPVKGLTALTRVGVSFTDQQKKTIESLVEQNKATDAQKIILGELQSEFGGAAEAQATMGEKVSVAWGNIQEKIGFALLPFVRSVQRVFLREAVPALDRFSDWFRKDGTPAIKDFVHGAKPEIRDFISDVKPLAEEALPAVASVLGDIRDVTKEALPYAEGIISAFNDMPDWAKKGVALGGLAAFAGQKAGVGPLLFGRGGASGGGLLGGITKAAPLPVYVVNDLPGVPGGGPGGPGSKLGRFAPYAAGAAPPIAALAATGATAYYVGTKIEPGVKRSLLTTSFGGMRGGDTSGDWAAAHPDAARSDALGDALNMASAKNDWREVLRLTQLFDGQIEKSTRGTMALRGAGNKFAKEFGVSLEDANRVMGGQLPKSADQLHARIDRVVDRQKDLTPVFLGNKAAAQELLDRMGLIAKDWRGRVTVDTGDSEARLIRILNLANSVNRLGALHASGVIDGPAPTPRKTGGGRRGRGTQINIHLDGKKVGEVFDERISTNEDLADERRRAGASR